MEIPLDPKDTAGLIDEAWELDNLLEPPFRPHLGASQIGNSCRRALWYTFRGCSRIHHSGRMLRLFARGQAEESSFVDSLKAIGCEVLTMDDATGDQFRLDAYGGHFGGSVDALVHKLPAAPATWHICEMKTSSDKYFRELAKKGVQEAKPQHYDQMTVYMGLSGLKRALYICVNKNDDTLYTERCRFDQKRFDKLMDRAKAIIFSSEPLEKVSETPDWFECSMCDHKAVCHTGTLPQVHCRTCAHSTPWNDGTWRCEYKNHAIPIRRQEEGCNEHQYIPHLVTIGEWIGYHAQAGVEYRMPDGRVFWNCTKENKGPGRYTSEELAAIDPKLISDAGVDHIRKTFDAEVVAV